MKLIFLPLLLLGLAVNAQIVAINYEFQYRLNTSSYAAKNLAGEYFYVDANHDGYIQVAEAQQVSELNLVPQYINWPTISGLQGIEAFTNLKVLNFAGNTVTGSLDLTMLTQLQVFNCSHNNLFGINLGNLTNLKELGCYYNPQLSNINLAGLANLESLSLGSTNIATLNLAVQANLKELSCSNTPLAALNLTGFTSLKQLNCDNTLLTALNLAGLNSLESIICSRCHLTSLDLTGLNLLKDVSCWDNQLNTLNFGGNNNIETIDCRNNLLTSINVNAFTTLKVLRAGSNLLTGLNLNGLVNLEVLWCDNNAIPALDLAGLSALESLDATANQLSSLNLDEVPQLNSLFIGNNLFTALSLNGLTQLSTLNCNDNQLTQLSLEGVPYTYLECSNNNLSALDLKDGHTANVYLGGNPNLHYVCCDEDELNYLQQQVAQAGYTGCTVSTYCSFVPGGDYYTIDVRNILDLDGNGCNEQDGYLPNLKYQAYTGGSGISSQYISSGQQVTIPVAAGQATTTTVTPVLENPQYYTVTPASIDISFPGSPSPSMQQFCIVPIGTHNDLEMVLVPLGAAVPGFSNLKYELILTNKGDTVLSGNMQFSFDEQRIDFIVASQAVSTQQPGIVTWNFANLTPLAQKKIRVTLKLNAPTDNPPVNMGDVLSFQAMATPAVVTDETPPDNTMSITQTVVNAMDPNDITCLQGETISTESLEDYLYYLVRFENTGNFPATNIVVADIVDTGQFFFESLQLTGSSHPCRVRTSSYNKMEIIFEGINLPAGTDNKGYVVFKIKPRWYALAAGDILANKADIFFDFNAPIATNTALTTIMSPLGVIGHKENSLSIYPNPVGSTLFLTSQSPVSKAEVFDMNGRLVQSSGNAIDKIEVSFLQSGIYLLKVYTADGIQHSKFAKK